MSRRASAQFAKKSDNTFRPAGKLGQRWGRAIALGQGGSDARMHTAERFRRRVVAAGILRHIIQEAADDPTGASAWKLAPWMLLLPPGHSMPSLDLRPAGRLPITLLIPIAYS
jgi:hypothetical protein